MGKIMKEQQKSSLTSRFTALEHLHNPSLTPSLTKFRQTSHVSVTHGHLRHSLWTFGSCAIHAWQYVMVLIYVFFFSLICRKNNFKR